MVRASWRPYCRILNRPCLEVHLRLLDMWLILALTTFSSGEWPAINLTYYLWKVTTEEWLAKSSSRASRELQATRPGLRLSGQVVGSLPSSPTTKPDQGLQTDQRNQGIWGAGLSSHWPNGRRQPWGCIWGGFKTAGEEQGCLVKTCVIHKIENNSNTTGKWKITLFAEFSWVTSFHSCGYQVTESSNMQGKAQPAKESLRLVTVYRSAPGLVNYQSLSALESTVAIADELVRVPLLYLAPTSREIKVT